MSEWKDVRLGDLCYKVCSGGTPKSTCSAYYDGGTIPWLNTKEINYNRIYQTESHITEEGLNNSSAKWIDANSVIVAMYGATAGRVAIAKVPMTTNQACCNLMIDSSKADYNYIYYYLSNSYKQLLGMANGAAQQNLNAQVIKEFVISLPNIQEQRNIASILSSLDDKIAVNRRICENLEAQAQALFKHWFIDFAPFKNGKFVESELGMIPEGWRVGIIDSFCKVFTGRKNTNQAEETGLYPFFSCAPEPLASNEYLYDGYAVIVAGNGSYTGRTTIYQGKFDLYQRTYACVAKEESFDTNIIFIYYMMKSSFEREKMGGTRGTSIPYIVMKDITHQSFCYNKEWVEKFSNTVKPMLDQQFRLLIESARLSSLRDTLLPKLMSGQIKVNEMEKSL